MTDKTTSSPVGKPVDISNCDTFEFMANVIGLPILHPGGLRASDEMAEMAGLDAQSHVLDVACGKGVNACYLAEKYGCSVVGIDIDERLIAQAREWASRKGLEKRVHFQTANAEALPFNDSSFDRVLFQAALIMLDRQKPALQEALRVLRPGGYLGVLELTWKKQPPASFFTEAKNICAFFENVRTLDGWTELVFEAGLTNKTARLHDMACPCTLRELGWLKALDIFAKRVFRRDIRKRMRELDRFVQNNDDYFGYGIYVGRKATDTADNSGGRQWA